jgi:hypothetical protein
MAQIGLKQLDSVLTGSLQVSGSLGVTGSVELENTSTVGVGDTYIDFTTNDEINFWAGGERLLKLDEAGTDEVVVGDSGDVNFRVATSGVGYNFYVKSDNSGGVDNSVGIRNSSPQSVLDVTGDLKVSSHVTASANISSSGTVTAEHFYSSDDALIDGTVTSGYSNIGYSLTVNTNAHGGGDFRVKSVNNDYQIFSDSNTDKVGIGHSSAPTLTSVLTVGGDITATHVTASGNVSGSATSTGSFGYLNVVGDTVIGGNLTIGDADTDSVSITADLTSNLTPNTDSTYDIGSLTKYWRNAYIDTLTTTGNVSGSSVSTGSFGRIDSSGRIFEAGSSVIDHATAMAIVFGG